jgi:serine/threonine protein phosphatase PrpC
MSTYIIEAGTAQHIGNRTQQNDRGALLTGARAPGYLLAVLSDGLQGDALASDQVLQTSQQLFDEYPAGDQPDPDRIADLLREIALEVHTIVKMNPYAAALEPQATVVLLMVTPDGQAIWAHVGDSRLYYFHNGKCMLRSSDSAYVEHLVQHDKLPPEAAKKHRGSKLLANTLGNPLKDPFVTIGSHPGLRHGDAFLLASDGLWAYFTDTELGAALARNTPRQGAQRLIEKAGERAHGKGDNCSMVIVKLVKPPRDEADYTVQKLRSAV